MLSLKQLVVNTLKWSHDRGILTNGNAKTQGLKLVSEVGELCDNLAKGNCTKDDIGDCLVVLTNIAALQGTTLEECWTTAWNDIKDRKGFLNAEGTFIKSTDPKFDQLVMEFHAKKAVIIDISLEYDAATLNHLAKLTFDDGSLKEFCIDMYDTSGLDVKVLRGRTLNSAYEFFNTIGTVL